MCSECSFWHNNLKGIKKESVVKKNILSLGLLLLSLGSIQCGEHAASDDTFNTEMQKANDELNRKLNMRENQSAEARDRIYKLHSEKVYEIHRKYSEQPSADRFVEGDGGVALEPSRGFSYAEPGPVSVAAPARSAMDDVSSARDRLRTSADESSRQYDELAPEPAPARSAMDDVTSARDRLRFQADELRRQQAELEVQARAAEEAGKQSKVDSLIEDVARTGMSGPLVDPSGGVDTDVVNVKAKLIQDRLTSDPELKKYLQSSDGKKYLKQKMDKFKTDNPLSEKQIDQDLKSIEKALNKWGWGKKIGIGLGVIATLMVLNAIGSS